MRSFATCLLLLIAVSANATDPPKGPLSPEESLKHFVLADKNLQIEIVAAEPEVIDPVAIQFDEHGRLWVVELSDYPNGPEPGKPPLSRIKLLEDKDGDGRYETAHIFADKLLFATGVQPWDGGVIVTLAGEVAYFKDTDGDHKADVRETWFTGFAQANPQLRANHPTFGPDGWIYVANGLRGGNVIAVKKDWRLGTPARPSGESNREESGKSAQPPEPQPVSLTGRDFKFDPLTGRYEAISGNGQFGMTFDAWGNRFVCDNRHPCRHVIFEEDFIKRCPHVAFPAVVHDVIPADDKNQVFPLTSAWTTSNLHAGTFTASCGVTVYTGDWLPEEFRGNVFVCEPTGNLVQRAILEPDGVTFKSRNPYQRSRHAPRDEPNASPTSANKSTSNESSTDRTRSVRATETQEFLASRDDWFRPVDLQNGPDGALYVVDMYRAVIEHPEWVPDELKKRPDTWLGNDKGRIYRIRSAKQDRRDLELDLLRSKPFVFLNDDGVDREDNPQLAGWYRPTASRILHERLIRQNPDEAFAELLWRCTGQSSADSSPRVLWHPESSSTMWQSPHLFKLLDNFSSVDAIDRLANHDNLDRLMLTILKRLTAEAVDETSDGPSRGRATSLAIQTLFSGLQTQRNDERSFFRFGPCFRLQAIQTWHELAPSPDARTALLALLAVSQSKFTGWDNWNLKDSWVRQAMIASEGDRPAEFLAQLIQLGTHRVGAGGMRGGAFDIEPKMWEPSAELLSAVGEQVGRNGKPDDVSRSVIKLCQAPEPSVHSFQIVASGLLGIAKGATRRRDQWNGPVDKFGVECAETLAGFAERTISEVGRIDEDNPHWSQPRRQIAIQLLPHLNDKKAFEYLKQFVESETNQPLRVTALESFAAVRRPDVDAWLVEHYRSETPAIRRAILAALFASKERQLRLLEAIEQGQIAATELDPVRVNQLTQAKDETLRERAKTVLAAAAPASRHEVLDAYRPALALTADPKRGREVFVKNCSTCHRVDNVGVNVAPDISDTRTKKPEQLLLDILDPNKAIDANYFAYAVVTKEGKTESGVISSETATSITLKQPEGKVLTLLRTDIDELRNTGLSLMPVGVEKNINQQAMADLIFWLKNWRYLDGKVPATSLK